LVCRLLNEEILGFRDAQGWSVISGMIASNG
jgi:hypothetical protein